MNNNARVNYNQIQGRVLNALIQNHDNYKYFYVTRHCMYNKVFIIYKGFYYV